MLEVKGVKIIDYVRKRDNVHVAGFEIHYTHSEDRLIEGEFCGNIFLSQKVVDDFGGVVPMVGDKITIFYNEWKRPNGFIIHNKA